MGTVAFFQVGFEQIEDQASEGMTFRFGDDKTLETKTMAILPVGIAGVNGNTACARGPLLSKECLKDLRCHIDLDVDTCSSRSWDCELW